MHHQINRWVKQNREPKKRTQHKENTGIWQRRQTTEISGEKMAHSINSTGTNNFLYGRKLILYFIPHRASLVAQMVKRLLAMQERPGFDPWVGKIPWRRKWQPTQVLLPRKFHGWRSLVGYSPWGHKQSDTTEWLHFHYSIYKNKSQAYSRPKCCKTRFLDNSKKMPERQLYDPRKEFLNK